MTEITRWTMQKIQFETERPQAPLRLVRKLNLVTNFKLALFSLVVLFSCDANAQSPFVESDAANQLKPSIEGYSPVSYFTKNIAEKGQEKYSAQHGGNTYFFTSKEQVELFNANPMKYRPRYKMCPYSLTLGEKLPLDPTNFKVVGDTLLLFHKSEAVDGLKSWNASTKTDTQLIELADEQFILLRF